MNQNRIIRVLTTLALLFLVPIVAHSATVTFRGDATAVTQESRATPANVEIGDVFTLTCNGKSVSFTATAATVANVTAGLTTAWSNSTITEHDEVNVNDETTYVEFLSDTPGRPFTITSSATDGGGANTQTLTMSTPTASAGPNHWDTASNWSGGAVPGNGDDVVIADTSTDILYGIAQSGVTLTSLSIQKSYTGEIGLKEFNADGYKEYRDQYLAIGSTTVTIGDGIGNGSSRIKLDTGSAQTTLNVSYTNVPEANTQAALYWKGTHNSNVVNILRGSVGLAILPAEVCTIATLRVGQVEGTSDSLVLIGSGSTLTTLNQIAGAVTTKSNFTTVNLRGGTFAPLHTATVGTLSVRGGTVQSYSTGTITTLEIAGGSVDFGRANVSRTVTNCTMYTGRQLHDPGKTVTFTNGIKLNNTNPTAVTLDIGDHMTLTVGAY